MSGKVFIKTFGCQMNEYDSDKMADVLRAAEGMEATQDPELADLILFNTCSVREKAQEKVFSDLGRIRHLKRSRPNLLIGVGGCVASQEGAAIVRRAPYVDIVFGPQTLHRLPELIARRRESGRPQVDVSFPEVEKFDSLPASRVEGASAFVSVMEGCSKYCSFCVVPYTRGEEVSRPFRDVLAEVAGLAAQGVKEVTLLGQNVNAYKGVMEDGETADFALLLEYAAGSPGIERIRYTTSHPREMTQRLIDAYARIPELVSHIHLPVQSGSDKVLAAMKRGYTGLEFKAIVRRLRGMRPDISLSTDFIVGFPGETEAEFEELLAFLKEAQLDRVGCFKYSPVEGAAANALPDAVPEELKEERLERFMEVQAEISAARLAAKIGREIEVIVDEQDEVGTLARSHADAPEIDGVVYLEGVFDLQPGTRLKVRVEDADEHDLWATPV
jgi:tRNA-2-methylthio-N6-dimethylallyladenosine synthase